MHSAAKFTVFLGLGALSLSVPSSSMTFHYGEIVIVMAHSCHKSSAFLMEGVMDK
jgi:hypothetical protein